MPDQKTISSTSQDFLDIYDITNDIIILKNGSASMVVTVNAMNFGLLAEQEQDAVIYSYAGLLNSINYPIQILIQSQTKDASAYLKLLQIREEKSKDEIKKAWIRRYSQFVNNLIKERNVLDKKFFVVIPASSLEMGLTPTQNLVSGFKEQTVEGIEKSIILEKAQNLLEPKKDHVIAQFNRIGLYARQLNTQEIIRLFYTNYNPEATEGQQITNSQSYTTAMVQAQIRGDYMSDQSQNPINPSQAGTDAQTPIADAGNVNAGSQQPVVPSTGTPNPLEPNKNIEPATTQEATPQTETASPTVVSGVGSTTVPTMGSLVEDPALQKPLSVGEPQNPTPSGMPLPNPLMQSAAQTMSPPVSPTMAPPASPATVKTEQETVEITQPKAESPANPMANIPSASTMPEPTKPVDAPVVNTPAMTESPVAPTAAATTDAPTQENINQALNQMTDK